SALPQEDLAAFLVLCLAKSAISQRQLKGAASFSRLRQRNPKLPLLLRPTSRRSRANIRERPRHRPLKLLPTLARKPSKPTPPSRNKPHAQLRLLVSLKI